MSTENAIRSRYEAIKGSLSEALRRRWAAAEAQSVGYGGVTAVANATGLSRMTIRKGLSELTGNPTPSLDRIRQPGAGRKKVEEKSPEILAELEALVAPHTRGHPESPLRWTCKSTRKLAEELQARGYQVTDPVVSRLLRSMDYSLQANRKTREGLSHPDRNAQFLHINAMVRRFQRRGLPVVSVDAKKKELVGDFKNAGQEWRRRGDPELVRSKDFPDKELGKALPYGILDIFRNEGWVSVGMDHDTAEFAVESLRQWWRRMGRRAYPNASELLVTADGGGSNGSRTRLWKLSLQQLADKTGLSVTVCHFPPGTSKWNKIEHRMFCHITENWRATPLVSRQVVVNLIANTTTRTGLKIRAALDEGEYETGIKVSDADMAEINIARDSFHGDWNYTIAPRGATC
jgi:hypothetical protein